jgi:rifampicin phosphotransferase
MSLIKINKLLTVIAVLVVSCASANAQTKPSNVRSLPALHTRAEFDSISRSYDADTPYPLPHVLFVIDRKDNNKIYYVNAKRYTFHKDFVNGTYLSLDRGQDFFQKNYIDQNRRFILGTLAYQTPIKRWTFEFWEGDQIPADLIKLTADTIAKTFFEPIAFKPNSLRQEELANSVAGLEKVLQSDISKEQDYQPLNVTKGIGRIHIIEKLDDHVEIGSNEILILNEVPVTLPPVAGIITTKPSTPLSHINLLAKSWGIPNAYIKNAQELFKSLDGTWIIFETRRDTYTYKHADNSALDEYQKRILQHLDMMKTRFNLAETKLAGLGEQRARSVIAYGTKSSNLGEVLNARIPGIIVPNGFTIPFYYYDQFIKENNLEDTIYNLLEDKRFVHDPAYRRERLTELRAAIQKGKMNDQLRAEVLKRVHAVFAGKGLFVRSSTNSEDLPNFNGAGLYNTVPNVKGDEELVEAIKNVWSSIWNFEAYEARERAGIDHTKVFMAVLIQEGINSESSGVMITTDPYDKEDRDAIYISAKRGLGIKVVEGKKIAEQIVFHTRGSSVQVLTRSDEDSLLTFDEKGGVKEIPITGERAVLTDEVIRRLVRAADQIKRVFGNRDQDIEWAYMKGQIYIVQSRPYISGS